MLIENLFLFLYYMNRKDKEMAPRRAEEVPVKRIAAPGCRLPARLPAGEVLLDITNKQWKLGVPIGYGGFGDIYLGMI